MSCWKGLKLVPDSVEIKCNIQRARISWLKKDIELLERTQDRALRLGNTNHVYETLEERRNRAQLMETYTNT